MKKIKIKLFCYVYLCSQFIFGISYSYLEFSDALVNEEVVKTKFAVQFTKEHARYRLPTYDLKTKERLFDCTDFIAFFNPITRSTLSTISKEVHLKLKEFFLIQNSQYHNYVEILVQSFFAMESKFLETKLGLPDEKKVFRKVFKLIVEKNVFDVKKDIELILDKEFSNLLTSELNDFRNLLNVSNIKYTPNFLQIFNKYLLQFFEKKEEKDFYFDLINKIIEDDGDFINRLTMWGNCKKFSSVEKKEKFFKCVHFLKKSSKQYDFSFEKKCFPKILEILKHISITIFHINFDLKFIHKDYLCNLKKFIIKLLLANQNFFISDFLVKNIAYAITKIILNNNDIPFEDDCEIFSSCRNDAGCCQEQIIEKELRAINLNDHLIEMNCSFDEITLKDEIANERPDTPLPFECRSSRRNKTN